MKKSIFFILLFTSIFFLSGCNNEVTSDQRELVKFDNDAQKAVEVFNQYRAELNNSLSRSEGDVTIVEVAEMDIPVILDEAGAGTLSRTANTEQVKLHRVTFSHGEKKGLAIVSADERVRSNFMYCEKGTIEDTAYIGPVAEYIREIIPSLCGDDLRAYYSGKAGSEETTLSRATQPTIYLNMKTKWGQKGPYNTRLTKINCGGKMEFPDVGCTGLAIAQALVYLLPDGYNIYPINEMRNVVYCYTYPWGEYNDEITDFIRAVSSSYTKYSCNGGAAWLADARNELRYWGYIEGTGYIYKSTNSLDKGKFYASLQANCPTLMSGSNGKGNAHTWILHGQRYNGSTREVYCNYGWEGSCDGWYSDWQRPKNQSGQVVISGSYYRDNKYMYFLENHSTPSIH